MRVRVLGDGLLASVIRRNLPAYRHEVVTLHSELTWIACDTPDEALLEAGSHAGLCSTPLSFAEVQQLPVSCAYVPENISRFNPDQTFQLQTAMLVGRQVPDYDPLLADLLHPIAPSLYWTTPLAAALGKHMLNSYLAACLTLGNEWAQQSFNMGIPLAEAGQAWNWVMDDRRAMGAPLSPGSFDGSHLWRDVRDFPKGLPLLDALAKCEAVRT